MQDTTTQTTWAYIGRRTATGPEFEIHQHDEPDAGASATFPLAHRVRHSPDGMEWGYGGSGPNDLARSVLIDFFERVGVAEEVLVETADFVKPSLLARRIANYRREVMWIVTSPLIVETLTECIAAGIITPWMLRDADGALVSWPWEVPA